MSGVSEGLWEAGTMFPPASPGTQVSTGVSCVQVLQQPGGTPREQINREGSQVKVLVCKKTRLKKRINK